jgi:hypothetical protein
MRGMRRSEVKAAAIGATIAIGVVAAGVVMAAVSGHEPKVIEEYQSTPPDPPDRDAVLTFDPAEPLVCMFDLQCLLHEVRVTGEAPSPMEPPTVAPAVPA